MAQYRLTLDNIGWRGRVGLLLATALGLAAVVALIVLSLGLFIILVPVVAVAFVIGRWRLRKMMAASAPPGRTTAPQTIEIDYKVIDGDERRR